MTHEFTPEELTEVIRSARAFNPGFSEKQLQSLAELQTRLADSGYLEAVNGLVKLEREKGVPLSQALEMHNQLLQKNEKLERRIAAQRLELETLQNRVKETKEKYREAVKATEHATEQLRKVKQDLEREERQLVAYRKRAVTDKQRIDEEVVEYRQKADVTEKEIATAGQINQEVTRHGFSLELVIGLAQEFAGYGNAHERLAEALKKHGKLTSYLAALEDEMKTLEENRHHMEGILSHLGNEYDQHKAVLSQLKAEIAEKGDLVGFYHRFVHLRQLMEYVGTSNQLTFHHCLWCGALFWILRPGNVSSSIYKCSWCGMALVEADRNAYASVAQPPGTPLRLLP